MVKHDEPGALPLAEFQTIEDVLVGLRERGGRATHARRLLLGALFADRQHHSAEELAEEVQAQAPDVNISTIYRNLDELVRLGVVDRSHLGGGPAAYHLASATHGHLVCEQCGAMTEVPGELFRDVTETLTARYGFTASPHRFSIIGRCADCAHDPSRLRTPPGAPSRRPVRRSSRPPTAGANHAAAPANGLAALAGWGVARAGLALAHRRTDAVVPAPVIVTYPGRFGRTVPHLLQGTGSCGIMAM